jgi:hypothetical protein
MKEKKQISLSSGKNCLLIKIKNDLIPNYYLIAFPKTQGEPTAIEISEMMQIGVDYAKQLSFELLGDSEAFSILYSGYSSRREKGWHIHIILLGSRWKKAWLYLILASKNIAQALHLRKDDSPKLK